MIARLSITLLLGLVLSMNAQAQNPPTFQYNDIVFLIGSYRTLPITYHFGKATMIEDSAAAASLDELARFLQAHPEVKVHIETHTDARGSAPYNQKLSELRIRSVYDYLARFHTINPAQIQAFGRGEEEPLIRPEDLTDELPESYNNMHRTNRRTVVEIVEIQR